MLEQIHIALTEIVQIYRDPRVHVCQLEATAPEENRCVLTGAVLNRETVTAVADGLAARFPQITFDITNVRVLRTAPPQLLTVATNVTGLHAQASFQSEMVSQLLNGWTVELLREESRWAFVSLPNHAGQGRGYLGWAYRPYLVDAPALVPTHIVCEPVSLLRAAPAAGAPLISRIAGGTSVAVDQETSKQVDEEVEQPDITLSPCHPSASSGQALVTLSRTPHVVRGACHPGRRPVWVGTGGRFARLDNVAHRRSRSACPDRGGCGALHRCALSVGWLHGVRD